MVSSERHGGRRLLDPRTHTDRIPAQKCGPTGARHWHATVPCCRVRTIGIKAMTVTDQGLRRKGIIIRYPWHFSWTIEFTDAELGIIACGPTGRCTRVICVTRCILHRGEFGGEPLSVCFVNVAQRRPLRTRLDMRWKQSPALTRGRSRDVTHGGGSSTGGDQAACFPAALPHWAWYV